MNHPFWKTASRIALVFLFILASIGMWAVVDLFVHGLERRLLGVVAQGIAFGLSLILLGALLRVVLKSEKPDQAPESD